MGPEFDDAIYWDRVYTFVIGFLSFPVLVLSLLFLLIVVCATIERVGDYRRKRSWKKHKCHWVE